MTKRQVFYSFHYKADVMRVAQIRSIGALEDNKPVSSNDWEEVKRKGESSIKNWIDNNLDYRSCLVVLVGYETARRKWIDYEIKKAWDDGKGVVGIYIHNIKCPQNGNSRQGGHPFVGFIEDTTNQNFENIAKCYNPQSTNAYSDIRLNLENWIEEAILIRKKYK